MNLFASLAHEKESAPVLSKRQQILEFIRATHAIGATCDEVEKGLKLNHQTVSARICDLSRQNLIRIAQKNDVAVTRTTRSGGSAFVWIAE